jgi:uncharacterized protein YbjQ (UPF0145 family)
MAKTYEPIATTTLGSSATFVTFSSIPSTYTDLVAVIQATDAVGAFLKFQFNGDTASNYSYLWLYGNGSGAISGANATQTFIQGNVAANITSTIGTHIVNVFNYSNATTNKTAITRASNSTNGADAVVGLWRNTSTINEIKFFVTGGAFDTGSTFTLYGIASA